MNNNFVNQNAFPGTPLYNNNTAVPNQEIRDFDSFKLIKLRKPLKYGYFFVKFWFLLLRNSW